jgi:hypothetical protein
MQLILARDRLTPLVGLLIGLLIAAGSGASGSVAKDNPVDAPDWAPAGITDPVLHLFTPASGAFFAQTAQTFLRSDDGGGTWRPVSLAPATTILTVDPSDHTILFAEDAVGGYKSSDDAATWRLILASGC